MFMLIIFLKKFKFVIIPNDAFSCFNENNLFLGIESSKGRCEKS